jgi:sulfur-carrier protein
MTVTLSLFGAFREFEPTARLSLEVPEGARVADLRAAVDAHGRAHWSGFRPELLRVSAFASEAEILRDGDALPADGQLAVLPPVSGG